MRLNQYGNRIFAHFIFFCTNRDKVEKFHASTFSFRKEKKNERASERDYIYNVLLNKHRNSKQ